MFSRHLNPTLFKLTFQALERVSELIDHGDEVYANQIALIDSGCAFYLVELLQDTGSDAVPVRAARVISKLTEHSAVAKTRLQSGPGVLGVENTVSKVLLNPVQGEFIDNGAIGVLVPWLFSSFEAKVDAAMEALGSLTSYNHDGKMAFIAYLVEALQSGRVEALEFIVDVVDGLEGVGQEAIRLLEGTIDSLSSALQMPGNYSVLALALAGTMCEKSKDLRQALVRTDFIAKCAVERLLNGPLQVQDAAARLLWHLTRENPRLIDDDVNGVIGPKNVYAVCFKLEALVRLGREQEAEEGLTDAPQEVCYDGEASSLLKSISSCHSEVMEPKASREVGVERTCVVM